MTAIEMGPYSAASHVSILLKPHGLIYQDTCIVGVLTEELLY